jgi:hypothetical protein
MYLTLLSLWRLRPAGRSRLFCRGAADFYFAAMNNREKIALADDPARRCLHKKDIFYKSCERL